MLNAEDAIGVADILTSETYGGEVRVNLGSAEDGTGIAADATLWCSDGFVGRPNDSTSSGATQAVYIVEGHTKRVIGTIDNRLIDKVGELQPGDRAIVSDCPARLFLKKGNSAVTIYTENETDGDKPIVVDVNGKSGHVVVINGGALVQMKTDEIVLAVDGGGGIRIGKDGVHIFGPHLNCSTGSGNLGVVGQIPPPLGLGSILAGPTGMTGVASTRWTVAI